MEIFLCLHRRVAPLSSLSFEIKVAQEIKGLQHTVMLLQCELDAVSRDVKRWKHLKSLV